VHVQGSGGVITDGTAVDASVPMQRFDAGGITAIDTGVLQVGVQRVVARARRTTARAIADPLSSVPGRRRRADPAGVLPARPSSPPLIQLDPGHPAQDVLRDGASW